MNIAKYLLLVSVILWGIFLFLPSNAVSQFSGLVFPNSEDRLQPVDDTWGYYTTQDLDWDGELLPDGLTCSDGQILKKTGADNWDCAADDTGGGGSGDEVTVNGTTIDTTANFLDTIYGDFDFSDGGAGGPDDVTFTIEYGQTLGGNPALLIDQCIPFADASGGGFLCEGSTANTNEQLYRFPNVDGADTTEYIVISDDANVSAVEAGFLDGVTAAIADTDDTLAVFAATTSAELTGILSDEDGTGLCGAGLICVGGHEHAGANLTDDIFLLDTGDIGTGVYDFGGATSFEIPNGAALTVNAAGEIAEDTTDNQLIFGTAPEVLSAEFTMSFAVATPSNGQAFNIQKMQNPITVTDIHCIVQTGTSAVIELFETDSAGASPATLDAPVTCTSSGAEDDGSLSNGTLDANDWLQIQLGATSGAVSAVNITVFYILDRQ